MRRTILVAILMLSFSSSWAEDLKLCGVEWPPFTYAEKGVLNKGISIDVYREAFKRLNLTFRAEAMPWPRCLRLVEEGVFDGVIDNAALKPFVYGDNATAFYPLALYARKDFPRAEFTWEGFAGKTIGMVRGYDYTQKISEYQGWKKELLNTDEQMLKMLKNKNIDYVLLDLFSASILSDKVGVKIQRLQPLVDSAPLFLVFNKDQELLARRYDAVIETMVREGVMDEIYAKSMPYSYTEVSKMTAKND